MDDAQQRTMALYLRDRASAFPDNENWCYGQYNETVSAQGAPAAYMHTHTHTHTHIHVGAQDPEDADADAPHP
jgi:hypothetical protein